MFINILEEHIIYSAGYIEDPCIYKIKLDGSEKINMINDFIYYLSFKEDEDILCRIRKDGTDRQFIV